MLHCTVVLSRGRPPFLTKIDWHLTRSLASQIKVSEVSNFSHYMYSEYIRVVKIEGEMAWIFSREIYTLNVHPGRLSVLFVDLSLWFWFVLFSWCVFFQFNFGIPFLFCYDCHTCAFIFGCSFQFCALNFVFNYNFEIWSTLVSEL